MWVCACVCLSTVSNMYILETRRPITIKLDQKHICGGGSSEPGFDVGRIEILVLMATYTSNRVNTLVPTFLIGSYLFLQLTIATIISPTSSNSDQIPSRTTESAALVRFENSQ